MKRETTEYTERTKRHGRKIDCRMRTVSRVVWAKCEME